MPVHLCRSCNLVRIRSAHSLWWIPLDHVIDVMTPMLRKNAKNLSSCGCPPFRSFERPSLTGAAFVVVDEDGQCFNAGQDWELSDTGCINDRPGWLPSELHARKRSLDALSDGQPHCDRIIRRKLDRGAGFRTEQYDRSCHRPASRPCDAGRAVGLF